MGQKFAAYDPASGIVVFYDSIVSPPPKGINAIEISDEQYQTCINEPGWTISNGELVEPPAPTSDQSLKAARDIQIATLATACRENIVSGFTSSALGDPAMYPTAQQTDRDNLQSAAQVALASSVVEGWTTPLWCEAAGVWSFVEHSAQQMQQVNADWMALRTSAQQRYADAIDRVNAATTVEDVQAITYL
jgi:hypothetical protein